MQARPNYAKSLGPCPRDPLYIFLSPYTFLGGSSTVFSKTAASARRLPHEAAQL